MSTLSTTDLTKEQKLVLLCSRGVLNQEQKDEIKQLLSDRLDSKEILYQGITHRTLNLMYYHLKNLGLTKSIEDEVIKIMKNLSKVYAIRNKTYFDELSKICAKLNESGIKAAILKGNYLAASVYPSIETRTFNDLDFLIDMKDGNKIVAILEEMGYIQGEYDEKLDVVVPSTRKQKMLQQLASNEMQECIKQTNDPFTPLLQVDLNFDILWKGNCPCKIDTRELLDRAQEVNMDGAKFYILDNEDFLIQLSCHLYKEAVLLHWINDLRDLKIFKFADIMIFIEKFSNKINWNKLVTFCKKVNCEKIVYYAFYYTNLMFGQAVPADVMEALEPDDKNYLDEYGIENEKPSKWQFDFFTRLFETKRVMELNEELLKNRNRFWDTKKEILK